MYLNAMYGFLGDTGTIADKFDVRIEIEKVKEEYFKETPKLPRKLKKRRRKELNLEYSYLMLLFNVSERILRK
jgi:hypothetical protein